MNATEWITLIRTRKCAVVGLGRSNLPLIDFLLSKGACVIARDQKTRAELGEICTELEAKGVTLMQYRLLEHIEQKGCKPCRCDETEGEQIETRCSGCP